MTTPTGSERDDARADLEPDVERLHRAILREPVDPEEGRERVPWWLWTTVVCTIFWGGWYLGRYGGSFDGATHVALTRTPQTGATAPGAAAPITSPIVLGKQVFARNCQACHQATGLGIPGAFPPLVGSEWVVSGTDTVGRILLNGLKGPVTVAGKTFNGAMPAWRDVMSDDEIAAVLTYVRQWAPNHASVVAPAAIAAIRLATAARGTPWTVSELGAPGFAGGEKSAAPVPGVPLGPHP